MWRENFSYLCRSSEVERSGGRMLSWVPEASDTRPLRGPVRHPRRASPGPDRRPGAGWGVGWGVVEVVGPSRIRHVIALPLRRAV